MWHTWNLHISICLDVVLIQFVLTELSHIASYQVFSWLAKASEMSCLIFQVSKAGYGKKRATFWHFPAGAKKVREFSLLNTIRYCVFGYFQLMIRRNDLFKINCHLRNLVLILLLVYIHQLFVLICQLFAHIWIKSTCWMFILLEEY